MRSSGSVSLGEIAGKLTMLEVACSKCERHGRLSVAELIERYGAASDLFNLRTVLAADCPRAGAGSMKEQCGAHYPQLVRLWRGEPAG